MEYLGIKVTSNKMYNSVCYLMRMQKEVVQLCVHLENRVVQGRHWEVESWTFQMGNSNL